MNDLVSHTLLLRQVVIATIMGDMTSQNPDTERVLELTAYWPYQITVLADRIARRTSRVVKEHGLNLSQWRVMAAVAEVPGRTSVEVVTVTPMDKGIVSRATKALLTRGFCAGRRHSWMVASAICF